jgi:hypothetical protein
MRGVAMNKRPFAVVIASVGVVLLVVAFARNLFAVGPAFEEMIDDFRPWLADQSITELRGDLAGLDAAVTEFQTDLAPMLAGELGMGEADFSAFMSQQFHAVNTGMETVPQAGPTFAGIVDLLDEQQANFASADAIPTTALPATTVPWGMALLGVAFLGLGIHLFASSTRISALLALIVGALVVVGAVVMELPGKAADADDLNEALKPVYTEEMVSGAVQSVGAIEAMGAEMQMTLIPGLGDMLGMSGPEVQAFLGQFPALSSAMTVMPESVERFNGMVGAFDSNLDNYRTLRPVAFAPIVWTMMVGAVIALIAGGLALLSSREEDFIPVDVPEREMVSV